MTHPRHRPLIWLALAAMLALALLPTVSRAMAFARGGDAAWAEVCTGQGPRTLAVAPAAADGDTGLTLEAHLDQCTMCRLAVDHPGLLPGEPRAGLLLSSGDAAAAAALPSPLALAPWRSAQPRGPPAGE